MLHEVFHSALTALVNVACAVLPAAPLLGQKPLSEAKARNIVLVHGAFADQAAKHALTMEPRVPNRGTKRHKRKRGHR